MNRRIRGHWESVHSTLFISRIIGGMLQVVIFAVIAREIGSRNFGPMIAALVTVQLVGTLLEFGFGALLMSRQFLSEMGYLIGTLLSSTVVISALEASIGLLTYFFIPIQSNYLSALTLLLLWGAGERLSNLGLSLAISQSDSQEVRRNILSRRLLAFLCFFVITLVSSWTMLSFCVFLSASSLVGGLISLHRYRSYLSKFSLQDFCKLTQLGFPFQVNSFINQLRNLDVFFLNFFASSAVAGNYALALRFSQPFSIPMSTLAQTGITAISSNSRILRKEFLKRYYIVFKSSILFGLIACFLPVESIARNILPNYPNINLSFKVQCLAFIIFGVIAIETSILQGIGNKSFLLRISLLWILITLLFTVAGGFFFGVVGASTGLFVGNLIQSVQLYKTRRNEVAAYE
jgi:O-antigen/teichoic acid export membrane protein